MDRYVVNIWRPGANYIIWTKAVMAGSEEHAIDVAWGHLPQPPHGIRGIDRSCATIHKSGSIGAGEKEVVLRFVKTFNGDWILHVNCLDEETGNGWTSERMSPSEVVIEAYNSLPCAKGRVWDVLRSLVPEWCQWRVED